ncbi:hypothetical protein [Flavivirga sp. 57AJ16]|uniref:hypothetical protein n=1 Tax=Flavivirga sp. 57AJ16 TaxID=3025307 RepID=UPI002365C2C6|nr:hypothetical protein [Flavivirga sp. 57AJ16]MDD7886043.1 hypothetical protein [Flavivirga sp. 57AJ16]
MPNRNIVGYYRYGYQGEYSEKDEETGLNAFELRMYDLAPAKLRLVAVPSKKIKE